MSCERRGGITSPGQNSEPQNCLKGSQRWEGGSTKKAGGGRRHWVGVQVCPEDGREGSSQRALTCTQTDFEGLVQESRRTPWLGSSGGWSVVPTRQGCRFDRGQPLNTHLSRTTHRSLALLSSLKINKQKKIFLNREMNPGWFALAVRVSPADQ